MSQAARIHELLVACSTGDLDAVTRILRKRGGLVNAVNDDGCTSLTTASRDYWK